MSLVEVVRGEHSTDQALATAIHLALQMGKTPVLVQDAPGFLVNRVLFPYLAEALVMACEGQSIREVDQTQDAGMTTLDLDRLEIVRNGDWFRDMSFKQVLSLAAQVTVSQMLERDDFQKRYRDQSPIGLHEFLYPLMQGYDSVMVRADVELGGSDQTFNLLVGREFQKAEGMEQQVCITHPLLVGLDGAQKMSKTLSNYVGVDESAKEIFGKLMSLPDNLMTAYFELLTDLPSEETRDLVSENTHPRQAKERLAVEIVTMYHGSEAADGQAEEFRRVFSDKELPSDMPDLEVNEGELEEGQIRVLKLMSLSGFISTNSEGRRLMQQGGVTIDGEQIQDPHAEIVPRDGSILKVGKRKFARLRRDA